MFTEIPVRRATVSDAPVSVLPNAWHVRLDIADPDGVVAVFDVYSDWKPTEPRRDVQVDALLMMVKTLLREPGVVWDAAAATKQGGWQAVLTATVEHPEAAPGEAPVTERLVVIATGPGTLPPEFESHTQIEIADAFWALDMSEAAIDYAATPA